MKSLGIERKVLEHAKGRIRIYPQHVNRASNIGHPCERFLVLSRTSWESRTPHDPGLQLVFDEGNMHERYVLRKLDDVGIEVIEQQRDYRWEDYQISGHIDGKVRDERGKLIPLEIKSTSPFAFAKFTAADDLVNEMLSGPIYHQLYPAQLLTYMWMDEKDRGLWIFKDKTSGRIVDRVLEMDPHVEYVEGILKKIERVNTHIEMGTTPPCYEEYRICESCGFLSFCHPDNIPDGQLEVDAELEYFLDLREELLHQKRPIEAQLKELDSEIKARTKGRDSMVIAGKWRGAPKEINVRAREGYSYTKWNWKKVKDENNN
jgi:hypothetical protein